MTLAFERCYVIKMQLIRVCIGTGRRGGLMVSASCYGNRDKLRRYEPLGSTQTLPFYGNSTILFQKEKKN